jgi:plastocyanin
VRLSDLPDQARNLRPRPGGSSLAGIVALAALLILGADARAQAPASAEIEDSQYRPPTLTVPVGTTVKWTNRDEETHTVTSDTGAFGSAGLDLGEEFAYTFTAPGTYAYSCDLHPFMHGTVVVK